MLWVPGYQKNPKKKTQLSIKSAPWSHRINGSSSTSLRGKVTKRTAPNPSKLMDFNNKWRDRCEKTKFNREFFWSLDVDKITTYIHIHILFGNILIASRAPRLFFSLSLFGWGLALWSEHQGIVMKLENIDAIQVLCCRSTYASSS